MIIVFAFLLQLLAFAAEPAQVDINLASEGQLTAVPGLGPAKARAIVKYRLKNGPYRRVNHLERVSGISSSTIKKLEPYLVVGDFKEAKAAVKQQRLDAPPYSGPVIDINTADASQLAQLPGVGATKAQAIYDDREKRGRFRSCRSLERVTGIGASTVEQLLEACEASKPERDR